MEMVRLASYANTALMHRIFILEGIATCCMVPLLFFVLPDYPSTTKWLTGEEKEAIVSSRASSGNTDHTHFQKEYLVVTLKREFPFATPPHCLAMSCLD